MSVLSEKQISVEKARELQANWNKNQGQAIENAFGYQDVRYFLFELEELQEFINQVRDRSREEGIANPGIRIYFGAYPDTEKNQATVFLAATKDVTVQGEYEGEPQEDEVPNNYNIMPLNTAQGGFPPTDY